MTSKMSEERLQSAILFNINQQTLRQMTLSDHVNRLNTMTKFLYDAINTNRENLSSLKQVVKNQTSNLKTSYQILQNQVKADLQRMKDIFEPAIKEQRKQLGELKIEANKIMGDQLTAKKQALSLEGGVNNAETQIGYKQLKK